MIQYYGVRTNILDNIDVLIYPGKITYIGGASGSGKSSLAFKTIADVSEYEYSLLAGGLSKNYEFDLDAYDGIRMTIPLKQLNFNTNPKSSILTYFGLKNSLLFLINYVKNSYKSNSIKLGIVDYCHLCEGSGYKKVIDFEKIIDKRKTLAQLPFKHWDNTYRDFYKQIFNLYLKDCAIDSNKYFDELTEDEKNKILYESSTVRYKVTYKYGNNKRVKTSSYISVVDEFNKSIFSLDYSEYSQNIVCPACEGARFNRKVLDSLITPSITLQQLLLMNFNELYCFLSSFQSEMKFVRINMAFLQNFIGSCIRLGIGHLNLSRGIISVSGGELQRLRLAKLLSGSLQEIVLVLDEPSSSLHPDEVSSLCSILQELSRKSTMVIVDHNHQISALANCSYYLARGSNNTAHLIGKGDFDRLQSYDVEYRFWKSIKQVQAELASNYISCEHTINIPIETFVGLCGVSGSGKTTILRSVLPKYIASYGYVSQKPIRGNINSTVGTYLDVLDDIKNSFYKKTSLTRDILSKCICKVCKGRGVLQTNNYYGSPMQVICESCGGSGYTDKLKEFKINDISFDRVLSVPIDSLLDSDFMIFNKGILDKLQKLSLIGLGYLSLNRKISTLSGGENQRIKLVKHLSRKYQCIGLDEPCQGLDLVSIKKFIEFIYNDIANNKRTYIVSEHNPLFLKYTSYLIELDKLGEQCIIVYEGATNNITKCNDSKISRWL